MLRSRLVCVSTLTATVLALGGCMMAPTQPTPHVTHTRSSMHFEGQGVSNSPTCELLRHSCLFRKDVSMRSTQRWSNRRQPRVVLHALMRDSRSLTSCGHRRVQQAG